MRQQNFALICQRPLRKVKSHLSSYYQQHSNFAPILQSALSRAVRSSDNPEVPLVMWEQNLPPWLRQVKLICQNLGGAFSPPAHPGTTGLLSKLHILQFTKSPMILSVTLHAYTCQKASKINNYLDKMTVCTLIFVHIMYVLTTFSYVCTIGSESL